VLYVGGVSRHLCGWWQQRWFGGSGELLLSQPSSKRERDSSRRTTTTRGGIGSRQARQREEGLGSCCSLSRGVGSVGHQAEGGVLTPHSGRDPLHKILECHTGSKQRRRESIVHTLCLCQYLPLLLLTVGTTIFLLLLVLTWHDRRQLHTEELSQTVLIKGSLSTATNMISIGNRL
jgi:hypothetical protein